MPGPNNTLQMEKLLSNAAWMRGLARSLVRDEATAEDVVQDAALAVLEYPPQNVEAPEPWLRGVLRNLALRSRRSTKRRARRERQAARSERVELDPAVLVERAELHQKVVEAVLRLDEPYRSTVLLRHFEGQAAEEIARMTGTPSATVRVRLHRAHLELRRRLDSNFGTRAAWCALLVPLALEREALAASTAVAASSASSVAASVASTSVSVHALALGGLVMSGKAVFLVGVIGVAALAIGFGVGRGTAPLLPSDDELSRLVLARPEHRSLLDERDALRKELEATRGESSLSRDDAKTLAAEVKELRSKLEAKPAADAIVETELAGSLPVSFGKHAGLEGLVKADWREMAEAVEAMNELMTALHGLKEGETPDPATLKRIQEENGKLVRLAAAVMGQVPTHVTGNGEFTHPIVLANLVNAVLDRAELPLSAQQKSALSRAGAAYEEEYERIQTGYDDSTPAQRKVLDELELKRDTMRKVEGALTTEQQRAVYDPNVRDRSGDTLSPRLMAHDFLVRQAAGDTPEAARESFQKQIAKQLKLDESALASLAPAFADWFREVEPSLATLDKGTEPTLDQVIAAGRAQANLAEKILALPGLSEEARRAVLIHPGWTVPVVQKKSE